MKKIVGVFICFVSIFSMVGCSSSNSGEKVNEILADNGYVADMDYLQFDDKISYDLYITKDGKSLIDLEDNEPYLSMDIRDYDDDTKDVSTAKYGVITKSIQGTGSDNFIFYSTSDEEFFRVEENKALESSMTNWLDSMSLDKDDLINFVEWKIEQIKKEG